MSAFRRRPAAAAGHLYHTATDHATPSERCPPRPLPRTLSLSLSLSLSIIIIIIIILFTQ